MYIVAYKRYMIPLGMGLFAVRRMFVRSKNLVCVIGEMLIVILTGRVGGDGLFI